VGSLFDIVETQQRSDFRNRLFRRVGDDVSGESIAGTTEASVLVGDEWRDRTRFASDDCDRKKQHDRKEFYLAASEASSVAGFVQILRQCSLLHSVSERYENPGQLPNIERLGCFTRERGGSLALGLGEYGVGQARGLGELKAKSLLVRFGNVLAFIYCTSEIVPMKSFDS
jgi:hypothetical protein